MDIGVRGVVTILSIASAGIVLVLSVSACSQSCSCGVPVLRSAENDARCALSKDALEARQSAIRALLTGKVVRWRELPDGYAFELPGDNETARGVVDMIILERRCCSFVSFAVDFEPDQGPLQLEMRTDPANKPFLRDLLEPTGVFAESASP